MEIETDFVCVLETSERLSSGSTGVLEEECRATPRTGSCTGRVASISCESLSLLCGSVLGMWEDLDFCSICLTQSKNISDCLGIFSVFQICAVLRSLGKINVSKLLKWNLMSSMCVKFL